MVVGIIRAGGIGQAFAKRLVSAGVDAVISNSRRPDSLSTLVRDLGPKVTAVSTRVAAEGRLNLVKLA